MRLLARTFIAAPAVALMLAGTAVASNPVGTKSRSFGVKGNALLPQQLVGRSARISAVVPSNRGGVFVIGVRRAGARHTSFAVRLSRHGHVDRSFGRNGIVRNLFPRHTDTRATKAVLAGDGQIAVLGLSDESAVDERAFVARFSEHGRLDRSYGTGGVAEIRLTSPGTGYTSAHATAIASEREGAGVVVGGTVTNTTSTASLGRVARLDGVGDMDSTFGTGGFATIKPDASTTSSKTTLADVKINKAGNVAAVGTGRVIVSPPGPYDDGVRSSCAVAEFNSIGHPVPAFGLDGQVDWYVPGAPYFGRSSYVECDTVNASALGGWIASGFWYGGDPRGQPPVTGIRFKDDGEPDAEFANTYFPAIPWFQDVYSGWIDRVNRPLVIPGVGGRMLFVAEYLGDGDSRAFVTGYSADGNPDLSFGSDALALLDDGVKAFAHLAATRSGNWLYVAGRARLPGGKAFRQVIVKYRLR